MPRKRLEVVTEGTQAPSPTPSAIKAAIDCGERALLVAMRGKVASDIDSGVPPHTLAPLMRQLRDLDKEIRALDVRNEQEVGSDGATEDEAWTAV